MPDDQGSSETRYDDELMKPGLKPAAELTPSHDDITRRWVTFGLLIALGVIALLALIATWTQHPTPAEINELLDRLFTPLVALAGTAVGFYFGERKSSR